MYISWEDYITVTKSDVVNMIPIRGWPRSYAVAGHHVVQEVEKGVEERCEGEIYIHRLSRSLLQALECAPEGTCLICKCELLVPEDVGWGHGDVEGFHVYQWTIQR